MFIVGKAPNRNIIWLAVNTFSFYSLLRNLIQTSVEGGQCDESRFELSVELATLVNEVLHAGVECLQCEWWVMQQPAQCLYRLCCDEL